MISAVVLLLAVSAAFMGIGIVYKRVPDTVKGEDVMFWYSLFSLVLLLPAEFYSGSVSAIPIPWIICLLLIGNFNIFGMLLLQTAMKRGNSGIAWAADAIRADRTFSFRNGLFRRKTFPARNYRSLPGSSGNDLPDKRREKNSRAQHPAACTACFSLSALFSAARSHRQP